jgi:auxin efflux carrier family protein
MGLAGPLILVAILYEGFGFALAFIIKRLFWVPHRFRWGIVVASVWANWGDIRKDLPVHLLIEVRSNLFS